MINQSVLMGRLTRDPETRYSQSGDMAITRFTIAVDRDYQKQGEEKKADFISCIAFGKKAEFVQKYFNQGKMIAIIGHIQTGSYTNKDGVKIHTTDVSVDKVSFTGEKATTGGDTPNADTNGFSNIPEGIDDELPFN